VLQDYSRMANSTGGLTVDMNDWLPSARPSAVPVAA
jgi:hypothetical protein